MSDDREILQILGDVIQQQLGLRDDQVILAYQKFKIPPTGDLLVVLSIVDSKFIGINDKYAPSDKLGVIETQVATVRDLIQIDIMSMSDKARKSKNHVVMALSSIQSEQEQEAGSFQIASLPMNFINTSSLEETQFLERYTATIAVVHGETQEQVPSYFDKFNGAEPPIQIKPPEVHLNV